MECLVTIAIPVYNAELYLKDSIQSCINQTYKNWELLLLLDGCTDNSAKLAYEMAKKDDRIKIFDDKINKGLIYRLNQSVGLAKGMYYARMDADDIMTVNRIEEQVVFLETHPEIDVVGTSMMSIDKENNIINSTYNIGKVNSLLHPTIVGRIEWFRFNHYAEWALRAEDLELWLRTAEKSNFYAIGKPLYFYREFGLATFEKSYASYKTMLKIYSNYKNYKKSFVWFLLNVFTIYIKIMIYFVFSKLDMLDLCVRMRHRTHVPDNLLLTEKDLKKSIAVSQ